MEIKTIIVGYLQTNCYLLTKDNNCLIVDPGDDFETIEKTIGSKKLIGILITHKHPDHIGALQQIKNIHNVIIIDKSTNLKHQNIENFNFDIIENPGHTNDSITFYFPEEKAMFCGDFLFKGTIGRTDLPTSNNEAMIKSLINIKKYPRDINIYPGHGSKSTLDYEFKYNPFLKNI